MKVIVFGATGMVGHGVLREALDSSDVEAVLVIGRTPTGLTHPKLRELVQKDLFDYGTVAKDLEGYDACFFCLGVSSAGMTEPQYTRITYELTLAAARALHAANPRMTFCYVSGAGTDSSEQGRVMWARVKGRTENALLAMGFGRAFMFRPGYIQPMKGATSKTSSYRLMYSVLAPLYPVLKTLFPGQVTTTERVGRAMLRVAKEGHPKPVLDIADINRLAS